jgi:hypothetical protein
MLPFLAQNLPGFPNFPILVITAIIYHVISFKVGPQQYLTCASLMLCLCLLSQISELVILGHLPQQNMPVLML